MRITAKRAELWVGAVAAAVLVFSLIPVWSADFFPNQDGPAHVWMISSWAWAGDESSVVAEFASQNLTLAPNWTGTILLWLFTLAVGPEAGLATLVTVLVVGFVLAAWYALGSIDRGGRFLIVLAIPIAYHWYLYRGSLNFAAGVVLLLAILGFWLRVATRPSNRDFVVLSGLLLLTYLSHPIPLLVAVGTLAVLQICLARSAEVPAWRSQTLDLVLAATPSVLLTALFTVQRLGSGATRLWSLWTLRNGLGFSASA